MSGPLIVAVDDDSDNIQLVEQSLTQYNYNVVCFDDGAKAWEYLQGSSDEVRVILLAKTLPNIKGMDLLVKVKEDEGLKDIPVIIQTVDDKEGKQKRALRLGAQFYLNKPIDTKKMLRLVRAAIRTQQRIDSSDDLAKRVGWASSLKE